ncbi:hypothetical protein [Mucilaginibacter rubeus]|uniref:hypothetical protein n=1 Tax=Mucilaginibacter rubeus TaxID=2027860 RepID=UPI00166A60C0|nr:hypothetical protein [Mucilaginibacter rubeus]
MSENSRRRAFALRVVLQIIVGALSFIGLATLMVGVLMNSEYDTISISNVGFVVLLALSNSCFSWARSLDDPKYKDLIERINDKAINGIIAAVCFMLGSLFKYLAIHLGKKDIVPIKEFADIDYRVFHILSSVIYEIAFLQTIWFILAVIYFYNVYKHRRDYPEPFL